MEYTFAITAMLLGSFLVAAGVVYLWSKDPLRRDRAWRLIKLLLRR